MNDPTWEALAFPGFQQMPVQQKAALTLAFKQRREERDQLERRFAELEASIAEVRGIATDARAKYGDVLAAMRRES